MAARFVQANGLRFAYLGWGPSDGPLALLMHGFPDTPATWRHLGPALAEQGYRVVAPWSRGYAPTAIPADGAYDLNTLAADLNLLHERLGGDERAVLVGHDWGAVTAQIACTAAPQRWRRVVTMAVPPLTAIGPRVRLRQVRMSWYIVAAQLPVERLPVERVLARIEQLWRDWSPGYEPTEDDIAPLRASLASPGSLTAALSYYRSQRREAARGRLPLKRTNAAHPPVLYLHGADDGCLESRHVGRARDLLRAGNPASEAEAVPGVGHFLHLERPDEVNARILSFLAADGT